ncbi:hypothetical protein L3Q82_023902 [Scortum barcoo]|uniref:Uncharacterized protein n=1 Tax=Scortum barcoo TaxID=214431 RepID=A0ACB8WX59_9TELE|nr:hypothetical protein L3Q82_023902 [Scortum barcoo]
MDSDEGYNYEYDDEEEECSEDSAEEEPEDDTLELGEVELVDPVVAGGERDECGETGGGGHGPGEEEEEDYRFEVLTAEQILQHMVECIREVNEVIQNPATITRILLSHFNWDKEKLMERYFDGNLDKLFSECHVINPSKKPRIRPPINTRSSAQDMPCQICYLNFPNSVSRIMTPSLCCTSSLSLSHSTTSCQPDDATERFKFQILVDHLKLEDALLIADSYSSNRYPYSQTMAFLTELYGQPHELALERITEVLDESAIKSGDSRGLKVRALVGMLDQLGKEGRTELECGSHISPLLPKLPHDLRAQFNRFINPICTPIPTLLDFSAWLEYEVRIQDDTVQNHHSRSSQERLLDHQRGAKAKQRSAAHTTTVLLGHDPPSKECPSSVRSQTNKPDMPKKYCLFCDNVQHYFNQCLEFKKLTKEQKVAWIKTRRWCWKCGRDHQAAQCYLKAKCQQCNQTHLEIPHNVNSASSVRPEMPAPVTVQPASYCLDPSWRSSCVLLKMVKVFLYNGKRRIETYAILDDGSERTILLHNAAQQLGLQGQCEELALRTICQDTRTVPVRTIFFSEVELPQLLSACSPTPLLRPAELLSHVTKLWQMDVLPYQNEKLITLSKLDVAAVGLLNETLRVEVNGIQRNLSRRAADYSPWLLSMTKKLIRMGGRLRRCETLCQDTLHPIVLDPHHHITKLIIQDFDSWLAHPGPERVFAELRRRFWILCGREAYFTGLECGHKFCMQCWGDYLTTKIIEEGMGQTISCPAHSCDILVDDNTVMRLITDSKVKLKYQHLITNSFVECNRLLKWCPAPDCHHVVKVQYPDAKPVRCKCGRQFCFNCGENWHDPVKCKWLRKWIKKCDDDSETSNWIAANTKECPKCHVTIEKDGGCNHMVCRNQNCKAEFCWVCLGPWEPHGSAWYNCNRYNEDDAKAARDAQERSRAALQRYLFYCNRYMNHMQSLRFEHKLYAQVKQKMEEMQQHNMSWIEVQFLKKAVDVLCQCRSTLMFTYVFAFYLKKNNQSIIFENNQADLENATEVLSGYLERDISQDSLQDIKQKVQDKYRYCESRRRVLLQHVHEGYEKDLWEYIED